MPKKITISSREESWDGLSERFIDPFSVDIIIEHSLFAIAKWEQKYCRSFFDEKSSLRTTGEFIDYVKFMTISDPPNENVYNFLSDQNVKEIHEYMNSPMTATVVKTRKRPGNRRQFITNELVYFWMTSYNIPFECQYWHFNRLITLIEIANEKSMPLDKKSKAETMRDYAALNAFRRKRSGSKG